MAALAPWIAFPAFFMLIPLGNQICKQSGILECKYAINSVTRSHLLSKKSYGKCILSLHDHLCSESDFCPIFSFWMITPLGWSVSRWSHKASPDVRLISSNNHSYLHQQIPVAKDSDDCGPHKIFVKPWKQPHTDLQLLPISNSDVVCSLGRMRQICEDACLQPVWAIWVFWPVEHDGLSGDSLQLLDPPIGRQWSSTNTQIDIVPWASWKVIQSLSKSPGAPFKTKLSDWLI